MGQIFLLNVNIIFNLINQIHVTFVPYLLFTRQFYLVNKLNDHTHFKVGITIFYGQGIQSERVSHLEAYVLSIIQLDFKLKLLRAVLLLSPIQQARAVKITPTMMCGKEACRYLPTILCVNIVTNIVTQAHLKTLLLHESA